MRANASTEGENVPSDRPSERLSDHHQDNSSYTV
jgi:hypothetical protein